MLDIRETVVEGHKSTSASRNNHTQLLKIYVIIEYNVTRVIFGRPLFVLLSLSVLPSKYELSRYLSAPENFSMTCVFIVSFYAGVSVILCACANGWRVVSSLCQKELVCGMLITSVDLPP